MFMKTIIYGAGNYAQKTYLYLYSKKENNQIEGFVVTENKSLNNLYGKTVWNLEEIKNKIKEYRVIVAISPIKSQPIIHNLDELGVKNIVQISKEEYDSFFDRAIEEFKNWEIDEQQIFFDSFEGMGYQDNGKYLAEYLIKNHPELKLIWDVSDFCDCEFPEQIKVVKRLSPEYYAAFFTSHFLVSNNGTEDDLPKKKGQYYINTWHGTGPFKKVGRSMNNVSEFVIDTFKLRSERTDLMISNSADNSDMFRTSFMYEGEIAEWGCPRVDILLNDSGQVARNCREKLGLSHDVGVVLFAPTFRDDLDKSYDNYDIDCNALIEKLRDRFGKDFIVLFREHSYLHRSNIVHKTNGYWKDVSRYPDVMELLLIADVLITDYSSIMWDFSLMKRPVFLYQKDLQEYIDTDRDFYWPVETWPYPKTNNLDMLYRLIEEFDEKKYLNELESFFEKDPSYDDGHACERLASRIIHLIESQSKNDSW